jgi:hypothetical protein
MTAEQVARVAGNLLSVLKNEKLTSLDAIRRRLGSEIDPKPGKPYAGQEVVTVSAHPQNPAATVVSYKHGGQQAPIMLILTDAYAKIMLTAEKGLNGYEVFDEEPDFGLMQDRKWPGGDLQPVLDELSALSAVAAKKS